MLDTLERSNMVIWWTDLHILLAPWLCYLASSTLVLQNLTDYLTLTFNSHSYVTSKSYILLFELLFTGENCVWISCIVDKMMFPTCSVFPVVPLVHDKFCHPHFIVSWCTLLSDLNVTSTQPKCCSDIIWAFTAIVLQWNTFGERQCCKEDKVIDCKMHMGDPIFASLRGSI